MKHILTALTLFASLLLTDAAQAQQLNPEEQYLVDLINYERARWSLPALTPDARLTAVARGHSYEMASSWFFSQDSPTTGDVHSRLRQAGVAYVSASQNIAYDDSPADAHRSLMRATANRDVILSRDFTHVGVGLVRVGRNLMITENFIAAPAGGLYASARSPWAQRQPLASPWARQPAPQPMQIQARPQQVQQPAQEQETRRRRWRRSSDASQPRQCDLAGRWTGLAPDGMLRGRPITMEFWGNGTARGSSGSITMDSQWSRQGDTVTIVGTGANPSMANCPASQIGTYTLSFSADCRTVQVVSSNDACRHRNQTLQGFQARRGR